MRILSLVNRQEVPHFDGEAIEIKNIDVDDEPTVDILEHLEEACDWIEEGLDLEPSDGQQVGVLVHCRQGISRSGSFIVAYSEFQTEAFAPCIVPASPCGHIILTIPSK